MLQAALAAGLAAEGVAVIDVGVLPTPAIAGLSAARELPAAVLSASHNPFPDNGVKLFSRGGRKLPDAVEDELESVLAEIATHEDHAVPKVGADVGPITQDETGAEAYVARLVTALDGATLDGLHVIVDCANGAASAVAGEVFRAVGAQVTVMHAQPDGTNINHGCGSTHPQSLQDAVRAARADLGLALDGDADRVVAVDHTGELVDGDQLIALAAADLRDGNRLAGNTVVVTVMTNLGFRLAMDSLGIAVHETAVGDRYVLEALEAGGWSLGGEQSGHIIFRDLATTGDGILTGLLLAASLKRRGEPLATLAAASMTRLPQVLQNVRVLDREKLASAASVWDAVAAVEASLAGQGRVVLRPSGTEALIRVMVEAPSLEAAEAAAARITAEVTTALGVPPIAP